MKPIIIKKIEPSVDCDGNVEMKITHKGNVSDQKVLLGKIPFVSQKKMCMIDVSHEEIKIIENQVEVLCQEYLKKNNLKPQNKNIYGEKKSNNKSDIMGCKLILSLNSTE